MNRIVRPLLSAGFVATAIICLANPVAGAGAKVPEPGKPQTSIHFDPRVKVRPADLPGLTRLSFDDALKDARIAATGNVIKAELQVKDGNLVYSFDVVQTDRSVLAVDIDAGNGKVFATARKSGGYDDKFD